MFDYDEEKFTELVLHVATRMADDPAFGATKLNKVLFYADVLHYANFGTPITGAEYQKLTHGPAPRRLLPVLQKLKSRDEAVMQRRGMGSFVQKRLIPLREADLSKFSGTEIAQVEKVIDALSGRSAASVSALTHTMSGWQVADEGETIPYSAIFLYDGPVTEQDRKTARALRDQLENELELAGAI